MKDAQKLIQGWLKEGKEEENINNRLLRRGFSLGSNRRGLAEGRRILTRF